MIDIEIVFLGDILNKNFIWKPTDFLTLWKREKLMSSICTNVCIWFLT
jgi:hypothetical protein